jgi:hypothetical protein
LLIFTSIFFGRLPFPVKENSITIPIRERDIFFITDYFNNDLMNDNYNVPKGGPLSRKNVKVAGTATTQRCSHRSISFGSPK